MQQLTLVVFAKTLQICPKPSMSVRDRVAVVYAEFEVLRESARDILQGLTCGMDLDTVRKANCSGVTPINAD